MNIKNFILSTGIFVFSGILTSSPLIAKSPKTLNLLALPQISLEQGVSSGIGASDEPRLRDQNEQSDVALLVKRGAPTELVYFFGGTTISPKEIRLKLSATSETKAKIEVLVSTLSSSTGFKSLRVEPIKNKSRWQTFSFEQSAANWVIIKISAYDKVALVSIAEIQLRGHVGPPVTVYKFNESPASALAVLSKLTNSVDVSLTNDEASLFADAADGRLDDWTFSEASLLSSGVLDKKKRARYLKQIDRLYAKARKAIPPGGDVFGRGKKLLKWLHSGAYKKGYRASQTDVKTVLDNKTFNCVSSATLYNILGRRFGLDVRGIEVPDHAFSILYDGTRHADIETTNKNGFNPERNKAGRAAFARETGFVYIPDKHRSKRRELGDAGLVALTYYNHGVGFSDLKQYDKALVNYFKALSLDPKNKSAVKNILATLANWSSALLRTENFAKALSVLSTGLELAPKNRTLLHNRKVVWQRQAKKHINDGNSIAAIAVFRRAFKKSKDKSFIKMQAWVFTQPGEKRIKNKDWDGALKLVDIALASIDEAAKGEIKKWQTGIYLRWSNAALKKKNFALAIDILERGSKLKKKDYRIKNNLGYVTQEWIGQVHKEKGTDASRKLITALIQRFPKLSSVKKAGPRLSDIAARKAIKKGNFKGAIAMYGVAIKQYPGDRMLKQNQRAIWDQWARSSKKKRDWKTVISIYEQAMIDDPKVSRFKQNIVYFVQEWSKDVAKEKGAVAAEKLISSYAARFPALKNIEKMRGRAVRDDVLKSVKAGHFDRAEQQLSNIKNHFPSESDFKNLVVTVYYRWAKTYSSKGKQQEAISVYAKGFGKYPKNAKMKRNLIASWHALADKYLKKKQWQKAIDIYQQGLKQLPDTSLFKRNIKYCQQQLKS